MNNNIKISIITVCLNAGQTIEKTIASIIDQSWPNIEYIIIDGKSDDNTLDIIEKFRNRISIFVSEKDMGIYDGMNKGIKKANGDFLLFINANDFIIHPRALENAILKISDLGLERFDVFFGNVLMFEESNGSAHIWKPSRRTKLSMYIGSIGHPACLIKSQAFVKNGLYDCSYKIAGDYEWFVRGFLKNGLKFKYIDALITLFAEGGISTDSKWTEIQKNEKERIINSYYSYKEQVYYNFRKFLRKNIKI